MEPLETDGNLGVPLKPLLAEKLPWLFEELGFRVTYSDYCPAQFGDSTVILDSACVRLRFVRDRGQIMIAFANLSEPDGSVFGPSMRRCIAKASSLDTP